MEGSQENGFKNFITKSSDLVHNGLFQAGGAILDNIGSIFSGGVKIPGVNHPNAKHKKDTNNEYREQNLKNTDKFSDGIINDGNSDYGSKYHTQLEQHVDPYKSAIPNQELLRYSIPHTGLFDHESQNTNFYIATTEKMQNYELNSIIQMKSKIDSGKKQIPSKSIDNTLNTEYDQTYLDKDLVKDELSSSSNQEERVGDTLSSINNIQIKAKENYNNTENQLVSPENNKVHIDEDKVDVKMSSTNDSQLEKNEYVNNKGNEPVSIEGNKFHIDNDKGGNKTSSTNDNNIFEKDYFNQVENRCASPEDNNLNIDKYDKEYSKSTNDSQMHNKENLNSNENQYVSTEGNEFHIDKGEEVSSTNSNPIFEMGNFNNVENRYASHEDNRLKIDKFEIEGSKHSTTNSIKKENDFLNNKVDQHVSTDGKKLLNDKYEERVTKSSANDNQINEKEYINNKEKQHFSIEGKKVHPDKDKEGDMMSSTIDSQIEKNEYLSNKENQHASTKDSQIKKKDFNKKDSQNVFTKGNNLHVDNDEAIYSTSEKITQATLIKNTKENNETSVEHNNDGCKNCKKNYKINMCSIKNRSKHKLHKQKPVSVKILQKGRTVYADSDGVVKIIGRGNTAEEETLSVDGLMSTSNDVVDRLNKLTNMVKKLSHRVELLEGQVANLKTQTAKTNKFHGLQNSTTPYAQPAKLSVINTFFDIF